MTGPLFSAIGGMSEMISVVIPTRNRPQAVESCLDALAAQTLPPGSFEVIVVDDGSKPPLSLDCSRWATKFDLKLVSQHNTGPAGARNRGVAEARGEFLAFTDDDCRPRSDWLSALRSIHGGHEDRLVGGRVENGLPADCFASASQALCDYLLDYFRAAEGRAPYFTSNNIGMSLAAFKRLGGFDESFGRVAAEDRDFGLRWGENGGKLVYAAHAVIEHYHAMTFGEYWRQHSNYGAGKRHLHKLMEARQARRPRLESFGFYSGLVLWPIRKNGFRRADLSILMALSQVAMVSGYLEAVWEERR